MQITRDRQQSQQGTASLSLQVVNNIMLRECFVCVFRFTSECTLKFLFEFINWSVCVSVCFCVFVIVPSYFCGREIYREREENEGMLVFGCISLLNSTALLEESVFGLATRSVRKWLDEYSRSNRRRISLTRLSRNTSGRTVGSRW